MRDAGCGILAKRQIKIYQHPVPRIRIVYQHKRVYFKQTPQITQMRRYLPLLLFLFATPILPARAQVELDYAIGADLSFLKAAEDAGIQFKDNGVVKPGLDIFRDHGYNWIRLRLFLTPDRPSRVASAPAASSTTKAIPCH